MKSLNANEFRVEAIEHIPIGVMTDKFSFFSAGKRYVARCYPKDRGYLADAEYRYMQLFQKRGILCPCPVSCIEVGSFHCLVYEYLDGRMLTDVYEDMNEEQKDVICGDVLHNYLRISEICCDGFGLIKGYGKFAHQSMAKWESEVVRIAEGWIMHYGAQNSMAQRVLDKFSTTMGEKKSDQPVLVWSDLSIDNIIVNDQGRLVGFVDFEGLMGADEYLGIGYMQAHENNSDFARRILSMMPEQDERKIDHYALLRYMSILPYTHLDLPNGEKRENINQYLSYVQTI